MKCAVDGCDNTGGLHGYIAGQPVLLCADHITMHSNPYGFIDDEQMSVTCPRWPGKVRHQVREAIELALRGEKVRLLCPDESTAQRVMSLVGKIAGRLNETSVDVEDASPATIDLLNEGYTAQLEFGERAEEYAVHFTHPDRVTITRYYSHEQVQILRHVQDSLRGRLPPVEIEPEEEE